MSDEWCFPPVPSQHYQASSQMSKVNLMLIIQGSLSLTPADMIGQLEDYLVAG